MIQVRVTIVVSAKAADGYKKYLRNVRASYVSTAVGMVTMDKTLRIKIDRLDGLLEDVLVLFETPGRMSAGKLQSSECSFYWNYGFLPCLLSRDIKTLVVFDVCGGLPMIIQGGVCNLVRGLPALLELCGAKIIR